MNSTLLLVSSGSWEAGLSSSYKRAFTSFGLRVVTFDLEAKRGAVAPLGRFGQRLMGHLDFHQLNARANRTLVKAAMEHRPAIVVVMCNEPVRAATLLQIKISVPSAKIINIFPDTLFNMRESVTQCLPLYDLFCTHTKAAIPHLQQLGCRAPFFLPLAADPTLHHPQQLSPADIKEFGCEVVYTGNWRPEHEELFGALKAFDLAIWGATSWGRQTAPGSWVRSRWRGRPLLTGSDYAKAHQAAAVCLNPIDPLNFPGHNQRVFELPACAAFSLVTRTEDMQELFREGDTVACFDGPDELVDKIRYYRSRPEERNRIASAAYKHVVLGGHTYRDRVRSLFAELGMSELLS